MKIDRHTFRKVLWAPTAALSVTMTLYLANLWISQNDIKPLNSFLKEPPQIESQEEIPKETEGKEEKQEKEEEDKQQENTQQEEKSKPEETKETDPQKPEEPAPAPTPPPAQTSTTVTDQNDGEGESSSEANESQITPPSAGNTDLAKYIVAKIQDLNVHGVEWNDKCSDELLASWKISSTTESLLQAIKEFMKDDKKTEEAAKASS